MANSSTAAQPSGRLHRATYSKDNRKGGFNVRVVGPYPERFAGKTVPVTLKDGTEHEEKLLNLIWTGEDKDPQTKEPTGRKAAVYTFEARPREVEEPVF